MKSINNIANGGVFPVKTKYHTRFVTNSGFKSSEVEELLHMKMQRVISLFQNSEKSFKVTVSGSFAQDGGICSSSKMRVRLSVMVVYTLM